MQNLDMYKVCSCIAEQDRIFNIFGSLHLEVFLQLLLFDLRPFLSFTSEELST
jgi:hypothetical protein